MIILFVPSLNDYSVCAVASKSGYLGRRCFSSILMYFAGYLRSSIYGSCSDFNNDL